MYSDNLLRETFTNYLQFAYICICHCVWYIYINNNIIILRIGVLSNNEVI